MLPIACVSCSAESVDEGPQAFCAVLSDSIGLYEGNAVTQMGYELGRIDSIEPTGGQVVVRFSVDADRTLPSDVRVVTRSKSLLADRSLELVGNYSGGETLRAGSCIPREQTFTPKSISEIAGSAADFIETLAPSDGERNLQDAVSALSVSLSGQGPSARSMMRHAARAAESPDKLVSDIGSSIENMAPLTETALDQWASIDLLMKELPGVTDHARGLWPGAKSLVHGTGDLIKVLTTVQVNYGELIWPLMHGPVTQLVKLAATESQDIAGLIETIPPVAQMMRRMAASPGQLEIAVSRPGTPDGKVGLLDLLLGKKN
ncbi:MlaD family protein [Gordonia sp. KTR9]|uniref:MlaD family protein n=1 Tax=Gordonia sp. KTR9 TaxID=337191 RepID=UPI001EE65821|nr:MlaD family protein [Gordonia sp. KTR9]